MIFIMFAAASVVLVAILLLLRDLFTRRDEHLERRVRLGLKLDDPAPRSIAGRTGRGIDRWFYQLIEEAGTHLTSGTALSIVAGLAIVGCVAPLALLDSILGAAGGLVLGALLPILYWSFYRWRRRKALRKHLPDTLELLAHGLRSGRNLEQSMELAAVDSPSPLKEEFQHCVSQLNLGQSPVAVLERMVRRIPIPEFRIFATAILVHRQTGGNLALLAERLAAAARDRQEFYGHVKAVTAGSRLSVIGLTIGTGIALALLYWLRPEYLRAFFQHELGPTLLIIAGCLQLIGILWVSRILRVQF